MSTRIEIELTSTSADGSWTWRAAGAKNPRGVLNGSILPSGASVGDQLRVEVDQDLDGIHVLSVVPTKEKAARDLLELLPSEEKFEPVVQHRATRDRRDGDRRRGPRRDADDRRGSERRDRRDGGERREGGERRSDGGERRRDDRRRDDRQGGGEDRRGADRRHRPHFTPPPEIPQRPKPKRLRPGKARRSEVLASLPEEQRPVAELALQGLPAVRQRLREDNARLKADGKPEMPEAAVLKMAEDLIPRLRVADWMDRAEAAKRQMEHLDLRDLRSVVAASDDPLVARDEATRELAGELKQALVTKQDEELTLWLGDVEAALEVGRVVRALRVSSQPPKAGVPFPAALATRLGEATTQSLLPTDSAERWIAVLEAAAFSPVRTLVTPAAAPESPADDLVATVKRLGPLLPQVAALFGIEVRENAPTPKPLRPTAPKKAAKPGPKPKARPDAPARPAATDGSTEIAAPTEAAASESTDAHDRRDAESSDTGETTESSETSESSETGDTAVETDEAPATSEPPTEGDERAAAESADDAGPAEAATPAPDDSAPADTSTDDA